MSRSKKSVNPIILEDVARAFDEYRSAKSESSSRTPDHLKKLALDVAARCGSRSAVAEAIGISPKTLSNWKAVSRGFAPPQELKLLEQPQAQSLGSVRIHLRAGICMEFCVSLLTPELLSRFSGGGAHAVG